MKLSQRLFLGIAAAIILLFALWSAVFYQNTTRRLHQHIDTLLDRQATQIIGRFVLGDTLPESLRATTGINFLTIERVSESYAAKHLQAAYSTQTVFIDDLREDEPLRVINKVFHKGNTPYELTLSTPMYAWDDTFAFTLKSIVMLGVALLVVILLTNAVVIRANMKPMYKLLEWLKNHRQSDSIPPPDNAIKAREFKEIEAYVLNASRLAQHNYEQQKAFIGDAAHELQTPLAVCRNRLELLVDEGRLDENQTAEVVKTLETIDYITRLNKSLLFLSKIDNDQFAESRRIALCPLIRTAVGNMSEIYESKHISIETDCRADLEAEMDPTLANSLISNVVKNAFVHNLPGGHICIEAESDRLSIANTGAGAPLDAQHVFDRFYKKSCNAHSSGLGLAIAKTICDHYGFHIEYRFRDGMHCFVIRF